jgi:uncharacterized SAM-binding protein YcdF (DUF218 family)
MTVVDAPRAPAPSAPSAPGRARRRRWPWALALLAGAVVLYVGGTFLQVWQASRQDAVRPAEAIVVLGAAQYDGRPSPALQARLDHAYELWDEGVAPLIVVTGGRQEGDRFTEATAGYNDLRARGVPDDAIRKEVQGTTTYESLAATARFLGEEGIDQVILVSSPSHSKRIADIAGRLGMEATVSPADGGASLRSLVRETVAVSVGRIVDYRRLERFTG